MKKVWHKKLNDLTKYIMRMYRKCNDFLMLKKEEVKDLSDNELLNTALDYEIASIYKAISFFYMIDEHDNSVLPIYYRMFLEADALKTIINAKKLDQTNYQLFKIQGNSRDIGAKERKKLANKLGISEKVFSRVIKSNRPYYLIGAVNDYEHFRNIFIEGYKDKYEDNSEIEYLKKLYDFLGVEAHVASNTLMFFFSQGIEANLDKYVFSYEDKLKKQLRFIKQIKTKPLGYDNKNINNPVFNKLDILTDNYFDLSEMFDKKLQLEYFDEAYFFAISSIRLLMIAYSEDVVQEMLPTLKVIYEKCGILYELNLGTKEERKRKSVRYEYSFFASSLAIGINIFLNDEKTIEQDKKEISEMYNKVDKNLVKVGKAEYINNVIESPVYAVYLEHKGFNEIAENIISLIDEENKDQLMSAYIHGVEASHVSGFSIFQDSDEYRVDILYTIKFLLIYAESILKLFKQVVRKEKVDIEISDNFLQFNVLETSIDQSQAKTYLEKIENTESSLRILKNTFEKEYQEDINTYIKKSNIATKEEIDDVVSNKENI